MGKKRGRGLGTTSVPPPFTSHNKPLLRSFLHSTIYEAISQRHVHHCVLDQTVTQTALDDLNRYAGLQKDISEMLDRLIPPSRDYGHEQAWHDGNGHSHLQATMMGPSLTVPVSHGQLVVGTWQQIFHLECDVKPRNRRIVVTVQGE